MNDGNDDKEMKGDANDKDFEWEVMPNYRGQRELFIAEYEFQGAAANILNYFSPKHLQKMKSIWDWHLCRKSHKIAGEEATETEIFIVALETSHSGRNSCCA